MTTETAWEVEWAVSVEREDDGSMLPDTAQYVIKDYATRDAAVKYAKTVVARDVFGSVRVTPFHIDELFEREYDGDAEYIEEDGVTP